MRKDSEQQNRRHSNHFSTELERNSSGVLSKFTHHTDDFQENWKLSQKPMLRRCVMSAMETNLR